MPVDVYPKIESVQSTDTTRVPSFWEQMTDCSLCGRDGNGNLNFGQVSINWPTQTASKKKTDKKKTLPAEKLGFAEPPQLQPSPRYPHCAGAGHKSLQLRSFSRPRRIWIEASPDRQYDFPHPRAGKNAPLLIDQRPLGEDLHVMPLHKGRPWQTGFAGSNLDHGRSHRPFTAEGNNQDGVPAVTEISLVERNNQYPMTNRRIPEVRSPDLPSSRQCITRQS